MSLPYFPLYPTDFDGKTAHLTLLEDGAYNRLLRLCWKTPGCRIPTDEAWIMRQMRARTSDEQDAVLSVLAEFFTRKGGFYTNKKLSEIYDASREAHERRKNAGSKGGKAKALKTNKTAPSNALAMAKQPEPEPEPYISKTNVLLRDGLFQEFWDAFPHRNGAKKDRAKVKAKWDRLAKAGVDLKSIVTAAFDYRSDAAVSRGYGKAPLTWLNGECWNDEIEKVFSHGKRTGNGGGHAATDSFLAGWGLGGDQDAGGGASDSAPMRDVTPPGDERMAAGADWDTAGAILRFPTAAGNGPGNF